ncbi:MAG: exodeoxyribonuclease V subunit gamma [Candidatus Binatia bacterium]
MARPGAGRAARRLGQSGVPLSARARRSARQRDARRAPAAAAAFAPEAAWAAAELPRGWARRFAGTAVPGGRPRRRCCRSRRVANLFDQYAAFRPELVRRWSAAATATTGSPPGAPWWRGGAVHPAARAEALRDALASDASPAAPLPSRVSIFGLATLPPTYVAILAALARRVDVHLFIPQSDARVLGRPRLGARTAARARRRRRRRALYLEGPPLLASLGRVGRDFQQILEERVPYQEDDRDLYRELGEATLLATLQSDLLALRVRGVDAPPVPLRPDDASIAVHSCHSPMREIEVLHDRLVALFAANPALQPDDVIVMAPSIDAYAPLIEAVFTSPDRPRLPFTIADRRARATRDVVDAFLRTLELLGGRLPASAVLDLLALEPVRARYAIAAEQLDTIRGWVELAGVRWGADADHRVAGAAARRREHMALRTRPPPARHRTAQRRRRAVARHAAVRRPRGQRRRAARPARRLRRDPAAPAPQRDVAALPRGVARPAARDPRRHRHADRLPPPTSTTRSSPCSQPWPSAPRSAASTLRSA